MKSIEEKALAYLGFAVRARRAVIGVSLMCEALKSTPVRGDTVSRIVLEAADTSANTHKRIADRTAYYHVPAVRLSLDGESLAVAVGKRGGTVGAVLVTDDSLAAAIAALYGISM
ncbi:MAG: hypothetical protein IKC75_07505 [Clostridia bacterium]|nr:hypothetical protein [Clostridia bacterium]